MLSIASAVARGNNLGASAVLSRGGAFRHSEVGSGAAGPQRGTFTALTRPWTLPNDSHVTFDVKLPLTRRAARESNTNTLIREARSVVAGFVGSRSANGALV